MIKIKPQIALIIVLIVVGAVVIALVYINLPQPPDVPSDDIHDNMTTCLDCHLTGENDAPKFPSWHVDEIEDGRMTENVSDCTKCHKKTV